jgi:uncharacterized protein (TIGR00369 family)
MTPETDQDNSIASISQADLKKFHERMARVAEIFYKKIPFHSVIGFEFDELNNEQCRISFTSKPELIGNPYQGILHGGVTATALDVVGGCMAIAGMQVRNLHINDEAISKKLTRVGTVDLRVDYLRPGKGKHFYAIAKLLRSGNKVAVVRMELHNEKDTLIALGTGTYMTG